jgi:hypothetical protein
MAEVAFILAQITMGGDPKPHMDPQLRPLTQLKRSRRLFLSIAHAPLK